MRIKVRTVKDGGEYCFCCGKELKKEYLLNLGVAGAEFELCRSCLKKLHQKMSKVLNAE